MLVVWELVVVGGVAAWCWWGSRGGLAAAAARAAATGIAALLGLAAVAAVWRIDPLANPVLGLGCALGVGVATFAAVRVSLLRRWMRGGGGPFAAQRRWGPLPRWARRGGLAGLAAGRVAAVAVLAIFVLNGLASASPAWRTWFEGEGLLASALVVDPRADDPRVPRADPAEAAELAEAMALQRRFFGGIGERVERGVELVAEKSGAKDVARGIATVRALIALDPDLRALLIVEEPALQRLVDHPDLRALLADEGVLRLVERLGAGSPTALYRLGDDPRLRRLSRDPDFRAAIQGFDLERLHARVHELRERVRRLEPTWRRRTGNGAWVDAGRGGSFAWRHDDRERAVRAVFDFPEPVRIAVLAVGDGRAAFAIDAVPRFPRRHADVAVVECDLASGHHRLTVAIPPAEDGRCRIRIYRMGAAGDGRESPAAPTGTSPRTGEGE